jgi:hypothetical protein
MDKWKEREKELEKIYFNNYSEIVLWTDKDIINIRFNSFLEYKSWRDDELKLIVEWMQLLISNHNRIEKDNTLYQKTNFDINEDTIVELKHFNEKIKQMLEGDDK